ncbi:MAG: NAD(+)/NADH kinase [archaeon]
MFNKIGIISRLDNEQAVKVAVDIHRFVVRKKLVAVPEEELALTANLDGGTPLKEMDVDMIITVGGDGTVLKTSMLMPNPTTPVMAVNMGRRGYLADVQPEDALKAVDACLAGKCHREEHMKLSVSIEGSPPVAGLNEVLIAPVLPYKMLDLQVDVGEYELVECRADGFIVATPTGSTAHAFSAGGPILDLALEAYVLAFICPMEPIHPIVVGSDKNIMVRLAAPNQRATVIVDGRYRQDLKNGTKAVISRSSEKAVFLRFSKLSARKSLLRFPLAETGRSAGTGA